MLELINSKLNFKLKCNIQNVPVLAMGEDDKPDDNDNNGNVKLETNPKTKIPALYRVLMMNDDYTPMEFVIEVLEKFFQKNREEATQIMLHVHQRGVGVCGLYAYDLAETKAIQVMNYARKFEHPLQVQLEKE
jgi:ATP-dependent Clp protease adaptor protein ClpS